MFTILPNLMHGVYIQIKHYKMGFQNDDSVVKSTDLSSENLRLISGAT